MFVFSNGCGSGEKEYDLLKEDFSITIKGQTVTKDNLIKKETNTYYLSINLNYKDLIEYDYGNPEKKTDLDIGGNIIIDSFTYSGKYTLFSNLSYPTGTQLFELKQGQTNKVATAMGVDEYKKVMDIYIYDTSDENNFAHIATILIIFADSKDI